MLGWVSASRGLVWQTNETLWLDAVQKAPYKPRALINYGETIEWRGAVEPALLLYKRAYAAIRWRQDHRTAVSKYYIVQDMTHNYLVQDRPEELWSLMADAGCDQEDLPTGEVKWTCHVSRW